MSYYTKHLLTYLPMLGALGAVPLSEAMLVGFTARRLSDISKVCHVWADLMTATETVRTQRAVFLNVAEMVKTFPTLPTPASGKPWIAVGPVGGPWEFQKDTVFAAQRVAGPNPIALTRLNPAGSGLAGTDFGVLSTRVTYSAVQFQNAVKVADPQFAGNLTTEIAAGRVFVTDYGLLAGAHDGTFANRQKYLRPVVGFFYAHATKGLLPVGIHRGGANTDPVVLPNSTDWERSKYWLQEADVCHHELCVHLAIAHETLLTFVNLTRGALHASHPIRLLLEPHFTAVALNLAVGDRLLINPGGMVDEILPADHASDGALTATAMANFILARMNPRTEIAARGCDDAGKLAFYPYRDDGVKLYDILRTYVAAILPSVYPGGIFDSELQQLRNDIRAAFTTTQRAGFPMVTVSDMVDLVTGIMYLSSVFHSAVNYPQWDHLMFVPSMPGSLYRPATEAAPALPDLLPPIEEYIRQVEVLWLLSGDRLDRIGQVPVLSGFATPHAQLLASLTVLEAQLALQVRPFPYDYLRPSNVTAAANL